MPTADRQGLREALAEAMLRQDWPEAKSLAPLAEQPADLREHLLGKTDALIAGPLAETLAQADTAAQAVAEQATQAARIKFLETEVSEALDRHEAVVSQKHWFEENWSDALAEVARLSAEVEALKAESAVGKDEWPKIDTVPRDGTPVLVYRDDSDDDPLLLHWIGEPDFNSGELVTHDGRGCYSPSYFTHWHRVPALPARPRVIDHQGGSAVLALARTADQDKEGGKP